jgi:hypothetical protein
MATERYLALAKSIYNRGIEMLGHTVKLGGAGPSDSIISFEEASARAWELFTRSPEDLCGKQGVDFAHTYWQSLKHPWEEQVLKCYAEAKIADERRSAEFERIEWKTASRLLPKFKVDYLAANADSAKPLHSWTDEIEKLIDRITLLTSDLEVETVRETIRATAIKPAQERYVSLEALRVSLEQRARHREEAKILVEFRKKHREVIAERIREHVLRCEKQIDDFDTQAEHFHQKLAGINSSIASSSDLNALESEVEQLERELIERNGRRGLLQATRAALRRQGYEYIDEMKTLGPSDILSIYLEDPKNPDRIVLLQVEEREGIMAAEIVRRPESSENDVSIDREAQERLCKAMDAIEASLRPRFLCELQRTPPGEKVRSSKSIPQHKSKRRVSQVRQERSI